MLQVFFLSFLSIFTGIPTISPRYIHGIGTTDEINDEQIECLLNQNYKFVYLRIFNNGEGDEIGMRNVLKVRKSNLEYFVYVTPDTKSSADQQAEDLLNFGYKHCAEFLLLFLEITDPLRWKTDRQKNVDFINEFVEASEVIPYEDIFYEISAVYVGLSEKSFTQLKRKTVFRMPQFAHYFPDRLMSRAMRLGFYTSWYDYKVITNNSNQTANDIIFYWNTLGAGPNAETASNINDFRPFGPFKDLPALKQYGIEEDVCGLKASKIVYDNEHVALREKRLTRIKSATTL